MVALARAFFALIEGECLARKELQVMIEEIITRLRNPRLVGEPHNRVSNFIPGIKRMPIRVDPETAAATES